jgi:glycosyltransferase involved in cell wall biosynthesis
VVTVERPGPPRVLVVGAGTRFLSALSYYTILLSNALAKRFEVAAIPMRQLLPTFLYPGRSRVGQISTRVQYDTEVKVLDDIDWYWIPGLFRDLRSLRTWKPRFVIFEWWTGTVLHTYLVIALMARLRGASIIVEFHEVLDSSEDRMPFARAWVWALGRIFFRLASAFVIHSDEDRLPLEKRYGLQGRPSVLIQHGPFNHHVADGAQAPSPHLSRNGVPPEAVNLLYFGVIRPYKGLEDLVEAFHSLDDDEVQRFWLTVVGETWEGWDLPIKNLTRGRHRDRVTLVNRFVDDDEVAARFAGADAVVLPYHRSSASGPAHTAMSNGLPLVVTAVGGLPAAVAGYDGAIIVPPRDPAALADAIRRLPGFTGRRYRDPHSWERTVELYEELMARIS